MTKNPNQSSPVLFCICKKHKLDKKTLQTNFFEPRIFEREYEGLLALRPSPQASKKTRGDDVSPIRLSSIILYGSQITPFILTRNFSFNL